MKRLIAFVGLATSSPCLAVVPMEIAKSGHATVPVEGIFGKARFVLDTGAGYELRVNRFWSVMTLVFSLFATALTWFYLMGVGR